MAGALKTTIAIATVTLAGMLGTRIMGGLYAASLGDNRYENL